MKTAPKRILVARTDRLGDVLMTLPSIELLRRALPDHAVDFVCEPGILEAIGPYLESRGVRGVSLSGKGFGGASAICGGGRFGAALLLQAPLVLLVAAWRAGISLRVGMYSKPASFALLNKGLRQHRSLAEKSEAEYNLDLTKIVVEHAAGVVPKERTPPVRLPGDAASERAAHEALEGVGIAATEPFLVLHPGMGGSALNLSPEAYVDLLDSLRSHQSFPLVVTRGPAAADRAIVDRLRALRKDTVVLAGLKLPVLREVFRRAALVIAPSTGPLHLAHYVGTKTIGLYSPVRSHRKERWAPYGGTGDSEVLVPDVDCPGTRGCLGPRCVHHPCMDRLPWGDLIMKSVDALKDPVRGES